MEKEQSMREAAIEKRECTMTNVLAGVFPIVKESGTAKAAMPAYTLVAKGSDGKLEALTNETVSNVIGITAEEAEADEVIVYYQTGEFFKDAINIPAGVDAEEAKEALRKLSIFLK
jgi:hypothetical protein